MERRSDTHAERIQGVVDFRLTSFETRRRVSNMNTTHIQFIDSASDESQATEMLSFLLEQDGCEGGRTLPAANGQPWRVQAFFADETDGECWLPDGMRRVFVPAGQRISFGLPA